jgi:hypothetical protein
MTCAEQHQREDEDPPAAGRGQLVEDRTGRWIGHLEEPDIDHHVGQSRANQTG